MAALLGAAAVASGAIAAHALTGVPAARLETASRYAMWHALAIFAFAALRPGHRLAPALWLLGCLGFSGGLVANILGAPDIVLRITPTGGGLLILGWVVAAFACARRNGT
ncbi:MAG: DUF423 domain-containing protein [Geminicoccaceae bacterium]|nr:DUF423 domain-containing protein [Geminicoccaceae bacterium]